MRTVTAGSCGTCEMFSAVAGNLSTELQFIRPDAAPGPRTRRGKRIPGSIRRGCRRCGPGRPPRRRSPRSPVSHHRQSHFVVLCRRAHERRAKPPKPRRTRVSLLVTTLPAAGSAGPGTIQGRGTRRASAPAGVGVSCSRPGSPCSPLPRSWCRRSSRPRPRPRRRRRRRRPPTSRRTGPPPPPGHTTTPTPHGLVPVRNTRWEFRLLPPVAAGPRPRVFPIGKQSGVEGVPPAIEAGLAPAPGRGRRPRTALAFVPDQVRPGRPAQRRRPVDAAGGRMAARSASTSTVAKLTRASLEP